MRFLKPLSILVLTAFLAGVWWWRSREVDDTTPSRTAVAPASPERKVAAGGDDPLIPSFERLNPGANPGQSLKELQEKLHSMDAAAAVACIRDFLASGRDKPTGLAFEIGSGGSLKQWPTFRTFLLDVLREIDPAAAADIGRGILAKPTTADEWALALRNVGTGDASPETNAYLRQKTGELIANPAWQAAPSVGYLNAFDVLVHTRAVECTPLLSGLIQRKDRKDLVHASFLTLDRLVQRNPTDMLPRLASDRDLQQSRPEMAAQQFARADIRDPSQQALVKSWLLDPRRNATELVSFAGVYPNNNRFVSNNLLTTETPQSGADLAAHDRAALEIIKSWSADPAFAPVKDQLATMINRLNGFVANSNE